MGPPNLRVVIDCVTFETSKIVGPAKYYRADKVYLYHKASDEPYSDFLEEVKKQLEEENISYECREEEINEFSTIMRELMSLIKKEEQKGNNVYVNVSAGSSVFCAAGLIACMMEGGHPFFAPAQEYTVGEGDVKDVYFKDDKPIGLTKKVRPPKDILCFNLEQPDEDVIEGLSIWKETKDKGGITNNKTLVKSLNENGLIDDIYEESRDKVSQSAIMKYRRRYLDKWIKKGWIEKEARGKYKITEDGKRILEVFG